VGPPGIEPGTY